MDTEIRDIVVPDRCICVKQCRNDFVIYGNRQTVQFSVTTCVLLNYGESTTALRKVKETDVPSIGEGMWTRTERVRITNLHDGIGSEIVDKTAWKALVMPPLPHHIETGPFLHASSRSVAPPRHG